MDPLKLIFHNVIIIELVRKSVPKPSLDCSYVFLIFGQIWASLFL